MIQILAICGSLQSTSANGALLELARKVAPAGVELVMSDHLRKLPHYNPDLEAAGPPDVVVEWRKALAECDAVLIASPEYGFSLPGVLKNGIDWAIGSGELERKVVAITTCVKHRDRGHKGLHALRETLNAVRARIVGGEPTVLGDGFEPHVIALLQTIMTEAANREGTSS